MGQGRLLKLLQLTNPRCGSGGSTDTMGVDCHRILYRRPKSNPSRSKSPTHSKVSSKSPTHFKSSTPSKLLSMAVSLTKNQTPNARNEPNQINTKEKQAESIDGIPEKYEGREWKGMIHRGSQDEGSCKLGPSVTNSAPTDRQMKTEETREINQGLAISFCETEELEELHKRYPT